MRSWSTLFGPPVSGSAPRGGREGAPAAGEARQQLGDIVAQSVELGYRVIDEYIRQGQRTAERMGRRSFMPDLATDDLQEIGMRMMQYASDFVGLWLNFLQLSVAGRTGPAADTASSSGQPPAPGHDARPGAFPSGFQPQSAPSDGVRVRIEVASPWPTEVSLDLRPDAARRRLVVHALRTVDPDKPRLDDVTFQRGSDEEPAAVRVRVPEHQPAGLYSGLLVDEDSCAPAGTLSVRVLRDPQP